ncbi:putative internalin [Cystobacter fuscus DSM 2262]|uniref:Internalin n=1 Tax=Cystobacter fuscus (strain ATCC 25194 / DSM 2262 / NBRC 100088 / M29) TaxID=1242864 RepID=S9PK46_CYSF2|nr:OmpA family protein [Cystobacter fuscus]EPX64600.1 putative internalin [Cystobacter fuscus DSM 2262]
MRLPSLKSSLSSLASLLLASTSLAAAPAPERKPRYWYDQHGSYALIGNTLAQGCKEGTPSPLVGRTGPVCRYYDDTSPDYFWTLDEDGQGAYADLSVSPEQARSQAELVLPKGARVTYARVYWAATRSNTVWPTPADPLKQLPDREARLAFRTAPSSQLLPLELRDDASIPVSLATQDYQYQSSMEITAFIRQHGSGLYQLGGVDAIDLRGLNAEFMFSAWWMVVFYELESEPMRHLMLFDGLDGVTKEVSLKLKGFYVPEGTTDAKLGVVAFDGDEPDVGDWFKFNGVKMENTLNPADNFFNSSRSYQPRAGGVGTPIAHPVSEPGDLPRLRGNAWSLSGLDLDIVDVSLAPGDKTAEVLVGKEKDTFWLGGFIASISTQRPDFRDTVKTVKNLSRTDGTTRPGDRLLYTITTTNRGDDVSVGTTFTDTLPAQLQVVPGSIRVNERPMTDAPGDDTAFWKGTTLTVYLGQGATAARGGEMNRMASATVSFEARVKDEAQGSIDNQALITAGGKLGADVMDTPSRPNKDASPGPTSVPVGIPNTPALDTPADGSTLSEHSPTYSGKADAGATVIVRREDGSEVCSSVADSTGVWSCQEPTWLSDGPQTVRVVARDSRGESAPVSSTFTVKTPDEPHTGTPTGGEDMGGSGPEYLVAGRGCSSAGGAPLVWLATLLLGMGVRSRRAVHSAGLVALGALSAAPAQAQSLAPSELSQSIDVQRYKPGPGATDILGVHGARVDRHLGWHLGTSLSYANNPLGFLDSSRGQFVYNVVATQVTVEVMGSLSLWDRLELGVALPLTYQASQRGAAVTPAFAQGVTGGGLGDLRLVPKAHLFSSGALHLGLAVPVVLPTAGGQGFRGGSGLAVQPQVVGEWADARGLRVLANLGAHLRGTEQLSNLRTGHELLFALGARVPVGERFSVQAQLGGALGLAEQNSEELPLELLASVRYRVRDGLMVHVGGGPGLSRGYGTPGFRLLAGLDWAQPGERAPSPRAPLSDTDGDGVADARDACPLQSETLNGVQDSDGCPDVAPPADADGDGLGDDQDRCVTAPEDADGFRDEDGCPELDNDEDGVADARDACPLRPEVINGVKDEDGCPDEGASKVRLESKRIVILEKVYFATGEDVILERSFDLLKQVASVLKAHAQVELLRVEGHTDDRGDDASNRALSQRRADNVRTFLLREGIAWERLEAVGHGESQPVDTNQTEAGRENNRRVEFNIVRVAEGGDGQTR